MDHQSLVQMQEGAYRGLKDNAVAEPTDAARRAELLADERERRLLTTINEAVYFGTLKAHLTLAVIGAGVWFLVVNVLLS